MVTRAGTYYHGDTVLMETKDDGKAEPRVTANHDGCVTGATAMMAAEMLQLLMQDRQLREEELESERRRWEEERH